MNKHEIPYVFDLNWDCKTVSALRREHKRMKSELKRLEKEIPMLERLAKEHGIKL